MMNYESTYLYLQAISYNISYSCLYLEGNDQDKILFEQA